MMGNAASILLIYTGGTIGMIENSQTGALENFNFKELQKYVPELSTFGFPIKSVQFDPPVDSSDINPDAWRRIVRIIADNYDAFSGFVILHGTDTMAYTASALSFMLEGLNKPVILTGSQLPIGKVRTDGKENLMTSIEIAAATDAAGKPLVPEVCIFFESHLMRGNRTTKINAENFNAFRSYNYPFLAEAGIHIKYSPVFYNRPSLTELNPHYYLDTNIAILKLFPGIQRNVVEAIFGIEGLKGLILETYGSGNAPHEPWLIEGISKASRQGLVIVNVSQCQGGSVDMSKYDTGFQLMDSGVVCGYDMTTESAVTKLMFLFGHKYSPEEVRTKLVQPFAGEITV
jgi:L-asparaginase